MFLPLNEPMFLPMVALLDENWGTGKHMNADVYATCEK
jgi:hypothetical protein